jgi:hypothetical protein
MKFLLERAKKRDVEVRFAPVWKAIDPFAGLPATPERVEGPPASPAKPEPSAPSAIASSPQWRWESSRGLEFQVPGDWAISDIDCGMTDAPTVARAKGVQCECLTREPHRSRSSS